MGCRSPTRSSRTSRAAAASRSSPCRCIFNLYYLTSQQNHSSGVPSAAAASRSSPCRRVAQRSPPLHRAADSLVHDPTVQMLDSSCRAVLVSAVALQWRVSAQASAQQSMMLHTGLRVGADRHSRGGACGAGTAHARNIRWQCCGAGSWLYRSACCCCLLFIASTGSGQVRLSIASLCYLTLMAYVVSLHECWTLLHAGTCIAAATAAAGQQAKMTRAADQLSAGMFRTCVCLGTGHLQGLDIGPCNVSTTSGCLQAYRQTDCKRAQARIKC
jgi:hypothetical protein